MIKRSKRHAYLFSIILTVGILICLHHYYQTGTKHPSEDIINNFNYALKSHLKPKNIIYWNNFFDEKHFGYGIGVAPFQNAGCKVSNCVLWDKADGESPLPTQDFDAVIFHTLNLPDKPPVRSPHQRYIFFLREAPGTEIRDYTSYNGFFNWTITYRRDSDIYLPYAFIVNKSTSSLGASPDSSMKWIEPIYEKLDSQIVSQISSKSKPVAWFVSHCGTNSLREKYVKHLSKHILVDIYGSCGTLTCRRSNSYKCNIMLENTYKFYLAFENSLCQDYVTEKFFRSMNLNVVPIVYGGANYTRFAPPMSYIDVKDYASPEELAKYLLYLNDNPEEYQKYFWWKKYYKIIFHLDHILCTLCDKLNTPELPDKVYDIEAWWNVPKICHSPQEHFKELYYSETVFYSTKWEVMGFVFLLFLCVILGIYFKCLYKKHVPLETKC